jgi:3,4-dihydroxy-2-butanone 4-phosphate synthase
MKKGLSNLTWVVHEWQKKIDNDEVTRPGTKVVKFFYERCRAVVVPMADDEDEDDNTAMFDVAAEESDLGTGIRAVNRAIQDALQAITNGHSEEEE